jgi:kynurenine 3-monooxygenase
MTPENKNIAIVGGGLVGSLLAIYLCRRGYNTTVFERRADLRTSTLQAGRSINLALSTRGIKALEECGLRDTISSVAIPMHGRIMHDAQGKLSFLPYGKEGQFINSVSRTDLNIILINAAEKQGAKFLFEHRCIQINTQQTQVSWTKTPMDGSLSSMLPADITTRNFDLIIGADGAFSAVRGALQFTDRFDLSQDFIDHGYKELHIAPELGAALERNALHIWPRESFMMIALPNPDGSFTCTLFLPFEGERSFAALDTKEKIDTFFKATFPDTYALMPNLLEEFQSNPTSSLVTMKCFPWVRNNTMLIGDAAHAVVPFYGQGMNAGFEDCRILNQLLSQHNDDWSTALPLFQKQRKVDADAIAQLALDNFIEMRDLVADEGFLLRKKIEARLQTLYPTQWIPQYAMVTFRDDIRYSDAYATGQKQKRIMDEVMETPDISSRWEKLDFKSIVSKLDQESI